MHVQGTTQLPLALILPFLTCQDHLRLKHLLKKFDLNFIICLLFSHNYPFTKFQIWNYHKIEKDNIWKHYGKNKKMLIKKYKYFPLVQIQSICRWQNKCNLKAEIFLGWVENIAGKGENAGYQHFPPFPTMFSKGFFFRVVKSWDCVVKWHQTKIHSIRPLQHESKLFFQSFFPHQKTVDFFLPFTEQIWLSLPSFSLTRGPWWP